MPKRKVELISVAGGANSSLAGSFKLNNKNCVLRHDKTVVLVNDQDLLDKTRPTFVIPYSLEVNKNSKLIFEYELEPTKQTYEDQVTQKMVEEFIERHQLTGIDGNPHANTKVIMYNLVDLTAEVNAKVQHLSAQLQAGAILSDLYIKDHKRLLDIYYYYGRVPAQKTATVIYLELADFTDGICMSRIEIKNFMKLFGGEIDNETQLSINIAKSKEYGILEKKNIEGKDFWYLSDSLIGGDTSVVEYFKTNNRIYNEYVIKEIEKREGKKVVVETTPTKQEMIDKYENVSGDSNLRAEVATLREAGFWKREDGYPANVTNMNNEKLLVYVEKARALKQEADNKAECKELCGVHKVQFDEANWKHQFKELKKSEIKHLETA